MYTVVMEDVDGNIICDNSYDDFFEALSRRTELAKEMDSQGFDVWVADEEELNEVMERQLKDIVMPSKADGR